MRDTEAFSSADERVSDNKITRTFRAFRYCDFRLVWAGAFTSTIGTWMQQVAQAWLVFEMTNSAFYLGLIAFLAELPLLLFTLLGGATADRLERRKLLLASQWIQMINAFILSGLIYLDWIQVWHFMVVVVFTGTAQAFGGPAYQALLPGLVNRRDIPNAIALNSIQFNLARTLGPVLAGLSLAKWGPVPCFLINGISFFAVIVGLHLIKRSFRPERRQSSFLSDIVQGLRFVRKEPALWQLCLLGFVTSFCAVPLLTMLPVFAGDLLELGSAGYSRMLAFAGLGAVTGALISANFSEFRRRGRLTLLVQVLFAVLSALFALSRVPFLSYLLLFLCGIAMIVLITSTNSLVQLAAPEEMRGRVTSMFMLSFRGGMPLGNLVSGSVSQLIGAPVALWTNAALLLLAASLFLISRSRIWTI